MFSGGVMKTGLILAVIVGGFSLVAQAAEIYKWVDSDGKVHYSDQPVAGKSEPSKLNLPDQPVSGSEGAEEARHKLSDREAEARKRKDEAAAVKAKRDKAEAEAREKHKNCEQARDSLRQFQTGQRLAHVNAQGQPEVMDDEARAQAQADAQKSVDNWCK